MRPTDSAPGRKILILFAHPALEKSRVNRRMILAVEQLPGVTVHDLYETYPDLLVDVRREQELLTQHDVIVFHHPFYWYSSPAIIKEWQDVVLEFNFAYGEDGTALRGKIMMNALTAGGSRAAYEPTGENGYYIRQLLAPFDRTAHLCGMTYLPPYVVHGTHRIDPYAIDDHALQYRRFLELLRDGAITDAQIQELAARPAAELSCINEYLQIRPDAQPAEFAERSDNA